MDEAGEQLSHPRHFEQGKLCTAAVCVYARQHASIQGEAGFPAFPLKLFISRARWNYCACSVTIWSNGQKGVIQHDLQYSFIEGASISGEAAAESAVVRERLIQPLPGPGRRGQPLGHHFVPKQKFKPNINRKGEKINMKKRLLASLMSLCLIVGLLPTAAFAAEADTTEEAPQAVVCEVTPGCTLEAGHEGDCV